MKISHRVCFSRWVVLTAVLFSLLVSSAFAEDIATPEQADAYSGVADASQMTTVEDVVEEGMIPQSRHQSYCSMYEEEKKIKEWEL